MESFDSSVDSAAPSILQPQVQISMEHNTYMLNPLCELNKK